MAVDEAKLNELVGSVVSDFGASLSAPLMLIGDDLGLYRALADAGPSTSADLAERTATTERYVREWLLNQGASGYVTYDPVTERWHLTEEQAAAFADPDSPANLLGAFRVAASAFADRAKIVDRFRSGDGLEWADHDHSLFEGTEKLFAPGYKANIVDAWIPALEDVEPKLRRGATVADVGCGHGASTVVMAEAYPESEFVGFDYHDASIERARELARDAGVADRVRFEVASASDFPGDGYDLVCHYDCLHDLGDPVGAARRVREALDGDGTWMIVEPYAGDRPEDAFNPVGRIFSAASTVICVPNSLAQGGTGLGAQAGEESLRTVVQEGGFGRFRRATETPFNLVLEARP